MSNEIFEEKCSKLKVIVSEVDGILTEDLSFFVEVGIPAFKAFYRKDFEVINELKKTFTFAFLSSDASISQSLAKTRSIPFFFDHRNKKDTLIRIMQRYSVSPEEIMYIGCSFSDLECINMIPFSVCPSDAVNDVKKTALITLDAFGGGGVLCEVYDILKSEIMRRK
jgi:3-deoxy-D-manno-octulosonate 8-phosphate phosphatase (KDO 8-P phosphatase)